MFKTDTAAMLAPYSNWADQILFRAMRDLPGGTVHWARADDRHANPQPPGRPDLARSGINAPETDLCVYLCED